MKNSTKIFASLFSLLSFASVANAGDTSASASWSDWTHDDKVLPELYVRSRCVQDEKNPKKVLWQLEFKDIGDALVEVKGGGFKYEVAAYDQAGDAQVKAKTCSAMPEIKMDGRVPSKGYAYKIDFKDGSLTVKPQEHHQHDWGSWLAAGMMGMAAVSGTMAANDAQLAQVRAQEQAQQQAAAMARAQQMAQLEAQTAAQNAAYEQRVAAERAARAAQLQAQLAAQQAAQQRAAQAAAQSAQSRSTSNSGNAFSAQAPGSSTPQPQPKDLSISQNYVDQPCNNGSTNAHFQLTNASYSNGQMTVEFDYQTGGVTYSFTEVHNLNPRSTNDYTRAIPCGPEAQLSDFGRSSILGFQFF